MHHADAINGFGTECVAIQTQKAHRSDEGRALVSINEATRLCDSEGVCRGKVERIGLAIGGEVLRPVRSGFDEGHVPQARAAP